MPPTKLPELGSCAGKLPCDGIGPVAKLVQGGICVVKPPGGCCVVRPPGAKLAAGGTRVVVPSGGWVVRPVGLAPGRRVAQPPAKLPDPGERVVHPAADCGKEAAKLASDLCAPKDCLPATPAWKLIEDGARVAKDPAAAKFVAKLSACGEPAAKDPPVATKAASVNFEGGTVWPAMELVVSDAVWVASAIVCDDFPFGRVQRRSGRFDGLSVDGALPSPLAPC